MDFDSVDVARAVLGTAIGALGIYGLTRLARLITVVHTARADLGRAAVARERMRFARDLHDLLGLSLSTVGPKAVEAHEAVGTDPARARRELGEILTIARHALTDVRLVAGGYRDISLELRDARHELARIAVAEERMRFARDLHDLLGLSLSAITLKAELAQRLLSVDRERTRRELTEIADISRSALADVRLVANGYRELSLNEESRSAESVLAAADVDVRLEMRYGRLSTEVRTVLATVLREGATNVLRHSVKGARCEITVRQAHNLVLLEIVNNGVAPRASPGGSGLCNLAVRVRRVGGELTAGLESDGTFRLSVRIPV